MNPGEERVAIVDDQNRVVSTASRQDMRRARLPHRACYVLVFNSSGHLFLHKRALTKDIFPGCLAPTVGGVVRAEESYEECAVREIDEELGIRNVPLKRLFEFQFADPSTRVWGVAFSCVYDGEIVLQREEVESGAFVAVDEILRRAETGPFAPDGLYALKLYTGDVAAPKPAAGGAS